MQTLFGYAYHPQADSQSKQKNCTIDQVIKALAYEGSNWVQAFTLVELAVSSKVSDSTMLLPLHIRCD